LHIIRPGERLEADATNRSDFIGQFLPNSPISRQYLAIFLLSRHYLAIFLLSRHYLAIISP
jgi:hypothetical protein